MRFLEEWKISQARIEQEIKTFGTGLRLYLKCTRANVYNGLGSNDNREKQNV